MKGPSVLFLFGDLGLFSPLNHRNRVAGTSFTSYQEGIWFVATVKRKEVQEMQCVWSAMCMATILPF